MNKLRLDYFLSLGLKLVEGDEYYLEGKSTVKITKCSAVIMNGRDCDNERRFITSFAPRKNIGDQPCDRLLPVIVTWEKTGVDEDSNSLAKNFDWVDCGVELVNITHWQPDLEALIKMQDAHDKGQVKPRVKVEYVKCDQSNTDVWDLKLMLENEELFSKDGSHCILYSNNAPTYMISEFTEHGVYRKVETEITWQSEVKSYVENSHSLSLSNTLEDVISCHDNDRWAAEFKGMCHLVSSMNK